MTDGGAPPSSLLRSDLVREISERPCGVPVDEVWRNPGRTDDAHLASFLQTWKKWFHIHDGSIVNSVKFIVHAARTSRETQAGLSLQALIDRTNPHCPLKDVREKLEQAIRGEKGRCNLVVRIEGDDAVVYDTHTLPNKNLADPQRDLLGIPLTPQSVESIERARDPNHFVLHHGGASYVVASLVPRDVLSRFALSLDMMADLQKSLDIRAAPLTLNDIDPKALANANGWRSRTEAPL